MSLISVLLFMASIRRNNAIVNDIDKKGKSQELLEKMSLHWDDDLRWDSIFMQRSLSMFRAGEMLQFSYSPLPLLSSEKGIIQHLEVNKLLYIQLDQISDLVTKLVRF